MNNRRSFLDAMNAGRTRRPSTSLEQLSQTLDELESRLGKQRRDQDPSGASPEQLSRDDRLIVEELNALRQEVRQQMGSGLRGEFAQLKAEIERAVQAAGGTGLSRELAAEFERLSGMIQKLSEQGDDRHLAVLRRDMEELRLSLGKLAREDTVKTIDRRWDELDRRWNDMADRVSASSPGEGASEAVLASLTTRLEQLGEAVGALPTSVTLRSLEERMHALAAAVDQFARQRDPVGPGTLDAIEERLNEISRAIAASNSPTRVASLDPEPFERLEARISLLARQIGEVVEEGPGPAVVEQLSALSGRVEDLAHRLEVPERTVERLAEQINFIATKLDEAPAAPDLNVVLDGIDQRFETLSTMLEHRQEDALAQGQALFRELEQRLNDVSSRINCDGNSREQGARLLEALDQRLEEFASRLEQKSSPSSDDSSSMRSLENRVEMLSRRIDISAQATVDPDLVRNLEAQIAGLASHLSQPVVGPEMGDIRPRLDRIEHSITETRQDVVEVARRAAEEAVRSFSGSADERTHVAGLAEDLKALEELTRKSDDRNAKTFEAIHDTLMKIADRLGALEVSRANARDLLASAPSMVPSEDSAFLREPAVTSTDRELTFETAAVTDMDSDSLAASVREDSEQDTPKRSMLRGLTRALSTRKEKKQEPVQAPAVRMPVAQQLETAPTVELDEPLDPQLANLPLEPGTGGPDLNAIMKRVRDERGQPIKGQDADAARSDFIAAARRAAQAAAAEAEMMKAAPASNGKAPAFNLGRLFGGKSRVVLMGVGAVLLAIAALQGTRMISGEQEAAESAAVAPALSTQTASITPSKTPVVEVQPSGTTKSDGVPSSGQSLLANPPETPADVTTSWLDAPTKSEHLSAQITDATTGTATEREELTLAAIPVTAGPVPLREAAAAGDPKAFYEIGNRYAEGRGVPEDMAAAANWYERAAEDGLAPAQYRIGNLYEKGIGRARDVSQAKIWYKRAADQGNASAMHNLAVLYAMGAEGSPDNQTAARWFSQAAELGVTDSQYNLGILAAKGVGMQQDLPAAYKWFALVAKTGDRDAAEKRDEVARMLSSDQLDKARAAADLWRAKPADTEVNSVEVPDSWRESSETTASIDKRQAVRSIQQILSQNGYDAGDADGMLGQKTQRAIAAFQKDNGMEPTGQIDEPLVRALLERS